MNTLRGYFSFLILFSSFLAAMQQSPSPVAPVSLSENLPFILEEKGWQEFLHAKRTLAFIGATLVQTDRNDLICWHRHMAQLDVRMAEAYYADAEIQQKIAELNAKVRASQSYTEANSLVRYGFIASSHLSDELKSVIMLPKAEQWDYYRRVNGLLIQQVLKEKGIKYPDYTQPASSCEPYHFTKEYFRLNPTLSAELIAYVAAGSFLLYRARDVQRMLTNKECPPIVFR